jgi:putative transposase
MPRQALSVFSGVSHHVTRRSDCIEYAFYGDEDREIYLFWLDEYCRLHKVEILLYCLMTNNIHLAVVPKTGLGLQSVLRPLHMHHAQTFNRQRGWRRDRFGKDFTFSFGSLNQFKILHGSAAC